MNINWTLILLFALFVFSNSDVTSQVERKFPRGDTDLSQYQVKPMLIPGYKPKKLAISPPYIQAPSSLDGELLLANPHILVKAKKLTNSGSIWVTGEWKSESHRRSLSLDQQVEIFLDEARRISGMESREDHLQMVRENHRDDVMRRRYRQVYQGIPVWGNELIVHIQNKLLVMTATWRNLDPPSELHPRLTPTEVNLIIENDLRIDNVKMLDRTARKDMHFIWPQDKTELVLIPDGESLQLTWHVTTHPSPVERIEYFVNALNGAIVEKYSSLCKLHHPPVLDGMSEGNGLDLNGSTRTVQTWQVGDLHILMDASKSMFRPDLSSMPEDPVGVILTLDAVNTFPGADDFTFRDLVSNSTTWNRPTAVSAHTNAEVAFNYFQNTFGRISINGQGGNIFSLIDVVDENGKDMDNAFWNGVAIFYGRGNQAFSSPLSRSLDVAAHELAHGVIQTTANLTYQGESGALNESFADVFASMIDRGNWQIGEDVVNPAVFRTGALRDLSNPHNGGSKIGDPGYQPRTYSERFTGRQDNGGVHINSGIPNHAFYLFARMVGNEVAEQIYFTVLDQYLTKSSQFVDLRVAVVTESMLRFGENSAVHNAARAAFDEVGILGETGGNYTEDVEQNPGEDFIFVTDEDFSVIRLIDENGQELTNEPISTIGPLSRPSVTDNGELTVFVAEDKTIQFILFDWSQNNFSRGILEDNPIWRNAAVSKDGLKIAAITDAITDSIYIFSLEQSNFVIYELSNPTTAEGQSISTGDVLFADAMEWDHTGEFLLYDAFNVIQKAGSSQSISYWDIGFIRVWDEQSNDYGDGFITKLFSGLPEDLSIGNPTFSKNSPHIIAFDLLDEREATTGYSILGVNIETGDLGVLYENNTLGYPNFSRLDDKLIFETDNGFIVTTKVVAQIDVLSDKINSSGEATILRDQSRWGIWFSNGERRLTTPIRDQRHEQFLDIFPNPATHTITVHGNIREPVLYDLITVDGLTVRRGEKPLSGSGSTIDVSQLSSGTYFLRLIAGNRVQVTKIYKN